jgi:hypothetical protein
MSHYSPWPIGIRGGALGINYDGNVYLLADGRLILQSGGGLTLSSTSDIVMSGGNIQMATGGDLNMTGGDINLTGGDLEIVGTGHVNIQNGSNWIWLDPTGIDIQGVSIDMDSASEMNLGGGSINLTGGDVTLNGDSMLLAYPSFFYRNALINGNFDVWQRGTDFNRAVNATFCADRWKVNNAADDHHRIYRSTLVPDANSVYSIAIQKQVDTSAGYCYITQKVENFELLKGRKVQLSLQYRNDATTSAKWGIWDGKTWTGWTTGSVVGAWTKATMEKTIASDATEVSICLVGYIAGSSIGAIVRFSQVQLNVGSTPLTYMPQLPSDEYIRCLRYFYCLNPTQDTATFHQYAFGQVGNPGGLTNYGLVRFHHPAPMRISPVITLKGTVSMYDIPAGNGNTIVAVDGYWGTPMVSTANLRIGSNLLASNTMCEVTQGVTYGDLWFDAEL